MNSTPNPPYKISRNFKFRSCGPNLHVDRERKKGVMFVLLKKTIKQRTLTEQARHGSIGAVSREHDLKCRALLWTSMLDSPYQGSEESR